MKIQVTQEDIDNGIPKASTRCAIALACKRIIPKFQSYAMGTIYIGPRQADGELIVKVNVPAFVSNMEHRFDQHQVITPFEFEIEL